jgi:hypothetical protein
MSDVNLLGISAAPPAAGRPGQRLALALNEAKELNHIGLPPLGSGRLSFPLCSFQPLSGRRLPRGRQTFVDWRTRGQRGGCLTQVSLVLEECTTSPWPMRIEEPHMRLMILSLPIQNMALAST